MAAEVVVVVEDQNPRARSGLAIEVGGGQAADPGADDNQIISFTGVRRSVPASPEVAVAQLVRILKRTWMTAAHAGQRRRVIACRFLRPARRRQGL